MIDDFMTLLNNFMAFVVTDKCIRCKFTDCVEVCPVDCFHEGPNFLVINPDECIDCNLCVDQCPVDAIYAEDDIPEDQEEFIEINERLSKKWPVIDNKIEPLEDASKWQDVTNKREFLEE